MSLGNHLLSSLAITTGWVLALGLAGSCDTRVLGRGVEEFRRVLSGTLWTLGGVAMVSYAIKFPLARGFLCR